MNSVHKSVFIRSRYGDGVLINEYFAVTERKHRGYFFKLLYNIRLDEGTLGYLRQYVDDIMCYVDMISAWFVNYFGKESIFYYNS
jgi:hypothetical protein